MINGIFGKKIGMTHIFAEDGTQIPVTVVKTDACYVVQRKVTERDGYEAVQIGTAVKKEQRVNAAMKGHFKKASTPCLYHLAELKCSSEDDLSPGTEVNCSDVFTVGEIVDVSGTSKGKGFQGSMKRCGFGGGKATHGSMHGRGPGSIGQSADSSRVFQGMKMAGQMGNKTITVQNLQVVDIKADEKIVLIKGAVPGATNGYILIKKAVKTRG